jgi:hypothetical protein
MSRAARRPKVVRCVGSGRASVSRLLVLATLLVTTSAARADLMGDAEALVSAWSQSGVVVARVATLFLSHNDGRMVALGAGPEPAKRCVTVVALGERQISFSLAPARSAAAAGKAAAKLTANLTGEPAGDRGTVQSQAGVAVLRDCGDGGLSSGQVRVAMDSPRGAVEVLVAHHQVPLVPLVIILPERAQGPVAPSGEVGEPLTLAPVAEREARARRAALSDGAKLVVRVAAKASERGAGSAVLKLTRGCHRVNVLADQSGSSQPVDIDADVRIEDADEPLRRDRSHAPDGRLDFCLGTTTKVVLRFMGAGGPTQVTVLDAFWPMPAGVPSYWGATAAAGLGWALHRRRAPLVRDGPVFQALGPPGVTTLPVVVEPGSCYVAAFSAVRGPAGAGRLTVEVGDQRHYDDATEEPRSGAVSFCAKVEATVARAQVDLRGNGGFWVLALWRLGGARQ